MSELEISIEIGCVSRKGEGNQERKGEGWFPFVVRSREVRKQMEIIGDW